MKIRWTRLAWERIDEIAEYIKQDDPGAASRWIDTIIDAVERLSDFPESGRVVPEEGVRRIRELIVGNYRVIYCLTDEIEILSVRRGSQLLRLKDLGEERD